MAGNVWGRRRLHRAAKVRCAGSTTSLSSYPQHSLESNSNSPIEPSPKGRLAQLPSPLIFSSEPLLSTSNPIRVNLIEQRIISFNDSVLPKIPESGEIIAEAHGAFVIWIRVVPGRRICDCTSRTVPPVRV